MSQMESPREQATVTVRVDQEVKDAYKERVNSMSQDLREHIESIAEDDDSDQPTPEDDQLEKAYLTLVELMNPKTRRIDVDLAESQIAQQTKIPSAAIRHRVFQPLERDGWIKPRWGHIEVIEQ